MLLLVSLIGGYTLQAQPWLKDVGDKPVKLQEIVAQREALEEQLNGEPENEMKEEEGEGPNYQFNRWKWYWERHTDDNGYLISPLKGLQEWQAYKRQKTAKGNALKTTGNPSNWIFQGPDSSRSGYKGIGRINVIAFHPTDTNTYWIGSAGGGAWKTNNRGQSWTPVNDNFPVLGVSDIEFNPKDPNTIYLCTGDRDGSDNYSVGVLKSTNGGLTWDTTGMVWNTSYLRQINDLAVNRINPNSLTLATNYGMYKSYDAGKTWSRVKTGDYKQLVPHPTDTSIIYTATYGGSSGNQIMKSIDGGVNWQTVLSIADCRRIALAVTPANPSIVKAIAAKLDDGLEGIYHSGDAGSSFTKIAADTGCTKNILNSDLKGAKCGGQSWYDLTIVISPLNPNNVIVGGVNTWHSTDGGISWKLATQWTTGAPGTQIVHADKHFHAYHPLIPTKLFEGNDGGIYYTNNPPTGLWVDITYGMAITQFYRNAVSNNADFVLGGAQDNGTKKLRNGVYYEVGDADGMECQIDYTNPDIIYTSQQNGELRRSMDGGINRKDIQDTIPGKPQGDWVTPIIIHPDSANIIMAGYKNVFISRNRGDSWTQFSPAFSDNIKRLAISPANTNYVYTVVNNEIRYTKDFGKNWQQLSVPYSGTISDIQADPDSADHIWITFSGYNTGSSIRKVAEYSAGKWTAHNAGLINIPVNCIVVDSSDRTLYIGTDFGIFYKTPLMKAWEEYNNNLPNVEIIDLGINYTTGELWAATYGRGMWKSPKNDMNINPTIVNAIPLAKNIITVYPNPNHGSFEIKTGDEALSNEKINIRIMGMNGNVVWQKNIQMIDGKASINAALPQGPYIMHVMKDNIVFAKEKIVVFQ